MSPRLPSLRVVATEAGRVASRFPWVLAAALLAAITGSVLIRDKMSETLLAVFVAATLGIPLFTAVAMAAERAGSRRASFVMHGLVVAALIAFAFAFPSWTDAVRVRRYAQLSIASHLLVAFLPYWRRGETNGFWQYNRILFLRFLTAFLFSAVLFNGLAVALLSLDQLFKIKVAGVVYGRLWLWIGFGFNTTFFLGGLPRDFGALEERRDYPAQLKVFAQYILIPLVAVYLAILTTYLGRVLITGQWPKGWIGWLVSCVATAGILSLLLVHPIRQREENRWVATYARWFYLALIPSIGMLLAAIGQRVRQYGITEDRYFLLVLAVWLAVIAVTFIARRTASIKIIPVTLCALALVTMFGPWSAYDVSLGSQLGRLRGLLARHGLLEHGVARAATGPVSFEVRKEMSGALKYLFETHGDHAPRPVLGAAWSAPDTGRTGNERGVGEGRAVTAMRALNLDYVNPWDGPQGSGYSYWAMNQSPPDVIDVTGTTQFVRLMGPLPIRFAVDGRPWELAFDGEPKALRLRRERDEALVIPADTLIDRSRHGTPAPTIFRKTGWSPFARVTLVARSYHGRIDAGDRTLDGFDGELFIGPPQPGAAVSGATAR